MTDGGGGGGGGGGAAPEPPEKMRRLSRKKALSLVKELDAFPKVSESYVETSASGGTGGPGSVYLPAQVIS